MDYTNNLRQLTYSFAAILNKALESEQIKPSGRIELYWDENGIDGRFTVYNHNDAEDGDIDV